MCEWGRLKKQDPELKAFIPDRQRSCDVQFKMTEETILQAVMDEKLIGALEVDLHVPDDLKSKFTITIIFSPYILPIKHLLSWFMIPFSSA
jgi:hypothetical protein